jgi:hypothetical protein
MTKVPDFTAEASLYATRGHYRTAGAFERAGSGLRPSLLGGIWDTIRFPGCWLRCMRNCCKNPNGCSLDGWLSCAGGCYDVCPGYPGWTDHASQGVLA